MYLSFDGGSNFAFLKRVDTYRSHTNSNPYTSEIRTLAPCLPLGSDVVVRIQGNVGRIHFEGFGLSAAILP